MKNIKGENTYKLSGVYCITNTITNKKYIGSSKNIYSRVKLHLSHLRKNKHHSPYLQNTFNKYGEDSFVTTIIEICENNVKTLRKLEKTKIDELKPEFNVMQNPVTWEITKESKLKISETLKRKYKSGEIKPYYNYDKATALDLYNFKEELIGTYPSISQLQKNVIELSKASIKNNLRKGIYFCKEYIIVPKTKTFDFCVENTIKNLCRIPIIKILNNQIEICKQSDYPHSTFELVNKNKGKLTIIRKRKEIFLHLGFLKKLEPCINSVNCGKPLELSKLQNS